jgi:hypothetical protein
LDERSTRIRELLHEAAETHHRVFRITDGADDDWASWYAQWLVTLSELPELLGGTVVRSELTTCWCAWTRSTPSAARTRRGRTTTPVSWYAISARADRPRLRSWSVSRSGRML